MDEIKEIKDWIERNREWLPIKHLLARINGLEEERDGFKNGQLQLQKMVSDLMDVNAKWANKVRELEKE